MHCWAGWTSDFCPIPDTCIDHGYMIPGANGTDVFCSNFCPAICPEGMIQCTGYTDFETGCQVEPDYCIDAVHHGYGFGADGPVDCPAFCWVVCDWNKGEFYCHGGFDDNGCELPGFCVIDGSGECPDVNVLGG